MTSYLAIIPAYNESGHITKVVNAVKPYLPTLVVDDGSSDSTASLAEQAGAKVFYQPHNQGKGAALRAGFRQALDEGCDFVITLDADGQHDPNDLNKFLEAYTNEPSDLIIGARNFSEMPFSRRLANVTGRWLFNWAMGKEIPDNQSGYRLISRRLMEKLLDSSETGYEFEVEMIATCLKNDFSLNWVPIRTIYADEKSHIRPFAHVTKFVHLIWQIRKQMHTV